MTPVHSKLIELGLEKRTKELREAGETHLFPKWHRDAEAFLRNLQAKGEAQQKNSCYPGFIPRRFNDTYKAKVGIVDPRKPWHTFQTGLARAGVSRQIQDDLCGHDDYSAGGRYIHDTSIEAMKEAIEKLKLDGFELKP